MRRCKGGGCGVQLRFEQDAVEELYWSEQRQAQINLNSPFPGVKLALPLSANLFSGPASVPRVFCARMTRPGIFIIIDVFNAHSYH